MNDVPSQPQPSDSSDTAAPANQPAAASQVPPLAVVPRPEPAGAQVRKAPYRADEGDDDPESDDDDDEDGKAPSRESAPARAIEPVDRFADVVSGQFDAEESEEVSAATKRVLAPQPEFPKLHKVLAQAGLGSRLEMEQLITEGRISVNNEPAHIGQRIQFGDSVKINGKPIRLRIQPPPPRVIAYHKEAGEIVTHGDPQNRPTVFRKLPKLQQGKWLSVGRLDINTEGLLLFTNSGELANRLMHPRFGLEREYAVRALGALSQEDKDRLLEGVTLEDGVAKFDTLEEGGGEGANCWYRVKLREGRNREVRRMFETIGHAVSRLIRIRYGSVPLPRGLRRGCWLELTEREIQELAALSGGKPLQGGRNERPKRGAPDRGGRRRGGGEKSQRPGGPIRDPMTTSVGAATGGKFERQRSMRGPGNAGGGQPDPMRTSLGYISNDRFSLARGGLQGRGGDPSRSGGPGGGRGNRGGRRRGGPSGG